MPPSSFKHHELPSITTQIQHTLPSPGENDRSATKRKHEEEESKSSEPARKERSAKRERKAEHLVDKIPFDVDENSKVSAWLRAGSCWSWTEADGRSLGSMETTLPSGADTYNEAARKGAVPRSWSAEHGAAMLEAGILTDVKDGVDVLLEERQLLNNILGYECCLPDEWPYKLDNFRKIRARLAFHNEARVEMDLGQTFITPSAERLHDQGTPGLNIIGESFNTQWAKTTRLHGPLPKPDCTIGLSREGFTTAELEKLASRNTASFELNRFPFIIRQAKSADGAILRAERQASHNTSVALNTILELHQDIPGAVQELHRKVLGFSVVHNEDSVRWYYHFVNREGGKLEFCKQSLFRTELANRPSDFSRLYKISVGICRLFGPKHLSLIKSALARLPDRAVQPLAAILGLEAGESSNVVSAPLLSQEGGISKRPSLSQIARVEEENAELRERLECLNEQQQQRQEKYHTELEKHTQESKEQLNRLLSQLEQQRQESHQREEVLRQREEVFRQREEVFRQREEVSRQQEAESRRREQEARSKLEDQLKEMTNLLKSQQQLLQKQF